jgi:hypothetical protein
MVVAYGLSIIVSKAWDGIVAAGACSTHARKKVLAFLLFLLFAKHFKN